MNTASLNRRAKRASGHDAAVRVLRRIWKVAALWSPLVHSEIDLTLLYYHPPLVPLDCDPSVYHFVKFFAASDCSPFSIEHQ